MAVQRWSAVRFTIAAALVAIAGMLIVYLGATDVGLYYDDYHFARPWSALELRRVWYGSWDPTGIESAFYRPLTAWWFAARFWLFGVNATAMHAVSATGQLVCSLLVGWFLRREGAATAIALLGAWLYAIHPALPYAQVSWLTNQMHLAESLCVLLALVYWQRVRDRRLVDWGPLVALAIVAFLIKEDGVMLLPALAIITIARSYILRLPHRPHWFALMAGVAVIVVALIGFRYARLGRLGGYATPTLEAAFANFWKGLEAAVMLWPSRRPWQAVASLMGIISLVAALGVGRWQAHRRFLFALGAGLVVLLSMNVPAITFERPYPLLTWQAVASGVALSLLGVGIGTALWRGQRRALFLVCAGVGMAFCFDAPFALVSKREQYHLLALGAVIAYAGAADALVAAADAYARHAVAIVVALSLSLALLARTQAADFLPCSAAVLEQDGGARGWWVVPPEIVQWLDAKAKACAAGEAPGAVSALPLVSWGVYDEQRDETGAAYRWTADHAVLLAKRDTASVTLAMRQPAANAARPVHVGVDGGDRPTVVTLDSSEWKFATVHFSRSALAWMRNGRRVDVRIEDWFVPAVLDPSSADLRRLGVELRIVGQH